MTASPTPDAAASRSTGRRIVLVMLAGIALYGVLVAIRGTEKIEKELATYAWWTFAAACGLSLVNYLLRFLKWEYYLRLLGIQPKSGPRAIPWGESLLVFLSGFVLTVTPGKVGEVFKSVVLRDLRGIEVVRTAPIVVAERLTDLVGIIVLITAGASAFPGGLLWAALGSMLVLAILAFVSIPALSQAALSPLKRFPGKVGAIIPKVELALVELRVMTTPRALVIPSLLSIGGWALEGVGVWIILRGFASPLDLGRSIFFYATATLAGALTPLPGGLGATEKVLEESMVALGGVPGPVATATMLLGRLATLWFAVAVGFVALGILRAWHPKLRGRPADPALLEPRSDKA
ncbi:MAG: flippase-like domain-containing protein [Polyangiaceae bacterium]|nr:flippase-like domain-containing protein [Polyangiaceae bacterium]